jgi:hypothetical protein
MWWLSTAWAGEGTATVPLDELRRLQDEAKPRGDAPDGVVDDVELEARVLDQGLDLRIRGTASVLGDGWVRLPLVDLGDAQITRSTVDANAWLALRDGRLWLYSQTPATYAFDVTAAVGARAEGTRRDVALTVPEATASRLELRGDPESVRLPADLALAPGSDAWLVRPKAGVYRVTWESVGAPAAVEAPTRRTGDPVVEQATASVVSTLEGTWLLRARFDLRFEGARSVVVTWPADQELQRVYVNGAPVAVEPVGHEVTVPVAPEHAGGDQGTLELVLGRGSVEYLLQGTVALALPGVSWPVRDWLCEVHLPEVYDYAWSGGSLVAADAGAAVSADAFSYRVPTPGEASTWHQQLVLSDPPTLRLAYTVDLAGAYYRP